jgi:uncharacterized protein (DUF305 family)
MEAAEKMYGPIMEGLRADDLDIAFVRAMIAQRQGAIELANVRLQYGKNEQTRKWPMILSSVSKQRSTSCKPG